MEQGWEEQGPRAMSFHGHAAVTRGTGLGWDNWWDGTEGGSPEAWRSPSRHRDRGQKFTPRGAHLCVHVCMGQHAGPHSQGPSSASKARCTQGPGWKWAGPPVADDRGKPGTEVHCDTSGLRTTSEAFSPLNTGWRMLVSEGCKACRFGRAAMRDGGLGGSVPVTLRVQLPQCSDAVHGFKLPACMAARVQGSQVAR